jgi:hypothetical protein
MHGVPDSLAYSPAVARHRGMRGRTPVYVVCSAHPRVGKTLVARLLTEFFVVEERPVAAFDVNPDEPILADYLPAYTALATIADTKGQVALFDQLIALDSIPKVVDLGQGLIEPFFALMAKIGFVDAAREHGIEPIVLFLTDPHRSAARMLATLGDRYKQLTIVPVHNDAVTKGYPFEAKIVGSEPTRVPVRIPMVSPALNAIIDRNTFSFAKFLRKPVDVPTELHHWIKRIFLEFRELELRLLLQDLRSSFQP